MIAETGTKSKESRTKGYSVKLGLLFLSRALHFRPLLPIAIGIASCSRWLSGLFLASCLWLLPSCTEKPKQKQIEVNGAKLKEDVIKANKPAVVMEQDEINAWIKSHAYEMQSTGTGLRYLLIKRNEKGKKIETHSEIKVNYKVWLLDGTLCYSSEKNGVKKFVVGAENIETGLHEGVKLMKEGEKALFVLPSHLAFGLIGDRGRIPPKSAVVYEIEVIEVK